MASVTVRQFADVLEVPVDHLISQLGDTDIGLLNADDLLSDDQQRDVLAHFRDTTGHSTQADAMEGQLAGRILVQSDALVRAALETNAFAVLGATLRDGRQRLVELAEERALTGREDESTAARAQVTNPRTRLAAEVGWFPGTSPAKVIALVKELRRNPALVRTRQGLNALTMANLMSSAMELIDPDMSAEEWAGWLVGLGEAEDEINAAEVLRDINEDRKVAGFPEVRDVALIEEALAEQRRHYKEATLSALENVASDVLVEAITRAVAKTTSNGERHAPLLIEDIASAYELRASHAIEKGATSVLGIVEAVRAKVSSGDSAVSRLLTKRLE